MVSGPDCNVGEPSSRCICSHLRSPVLVIATQAYDVLTNVLIKNHIILNSHNKERGQVTISNIVTDL